MAAYLLVNLHPALSALTPIALQWNLPNQGPPYKGKGMYSGTLACVLFDQKFLSSGPSFTCSGNMLMLCYVMCSETSL